MGPQSARSGTGCHPGFRPAACRDTRAGRAGCRTRRRPGTRDLAGKGRRWPAAGAWLMPGAVRGTRWCPDPPGPQWPSADCPRRIRPGRAGTGLSRPQSARSCSRDSCCRCRGLRPGARRRGRCGACRSLRGGRSRPWRRGGEWRGRVHVAAVGVAHPSLRRRGLGRGVPVAAPARGLGLGLTALGLGLAGGGAAPPARAGSRGARVGPGGARVGPVSLSRRVAVPAAGGRVIPPSAGRCRVGLVSGGGSG